jgi:hypothetical protein
VFASFVLVPTRILNVHLQQVSTWLTDLATYTLRLTLYGSTTVAQFSIHRCSCTLRSTVHPSDSDLRPRVCVKNRPRDTYPWKNCLLQKVSESLQPLQVLFQNDLTLSESWTAFDNYFRLSRLMPSPTVLSRTGPTGGNGVQSVRGKHK